MKKACFIIHGLSATPAITQSLHSPLKKAGFDIYTPLIAGHGTNMENFAKSTRYDWYKSVKDDFLNLLDEYDQIFPIGISLGTLLSMKLALEFKDKIPALVLISTPLFLGHFMEKIIIPSVKYTPLRFFIKETNKDWTKSTLDPEGREAYKKKSYPKMATNSVYEISSLIKEIKPILKAITQPLLIIHAEKDEVAPIKNVELVKKLTSSKKIETLILKNSLHVITMDYEKEICANTTANFLQKF